MRFITRHKKLAALSVGILLLAFLFIFLPKILSGHYLFNTESLQKTFSTTSPEKIPFAPSYVGTPASVKAIYMTSWVASRNDLRSNLVKLIDETELNSVVIDIKDYSGKIVFSISNNPKLKAFGSEEVRVRDMQDFIESLHKKKIYVIGRIAVFQDAYFVKHRPDLAVKNKTGDVIWKDHKGISWIDAGSRDYWDYIILLAKESHKLGFDEINFDYVRFPSDGNMQDISFPWSTTTPKHIVLKNFFEYLHDHLKDTGVKISADLFGMTTTAKDDMGIGQLLEDALPNFDYVMPMVYPSHYPPNYEGFKSPEEHPYDVVRISMESAVKRAEAASTTAAKLRPWLQDFGLKMDYGPAEVKAQIRATYDVGLDSWALWSASNKYTSGALEQNSQN